MSLHIYTIKRKDGNITTVVASTRTLALKKCRGKIIYEN